MRWDAAGARGCHSPPWCQRRVHAEHRSPQQTGALLCSALPRKGWHVYPSLLFGS